MNVFDLHFCDHSFRFIYIAIDVDFFVAFAERKISGRWPNNLPRSPGAQGGDGKARMRLSNIFSVTADGLKLNSDTGLISTL